MPASQLNPRMVQGTVANGLDSQRGQGGHERRPQTDIDQLRPAADALEQEHGGRHRGRVRDEIGQVLPQAQCDQQTDGGNQQECHFLTIRDSDGDSKHHERRQFGMPGILTAKPRQSQRHHDQSQQRVELPRNLQQGRISPEEVSAAKDKHGEVHAGGTGRPDQRFGATRRAAIACRTLIATNPSPSW